MADPTGQQIGNYLLLKELASGAFGSVYLARHSILTERIVAVKILHTYLRSPQEREQLVQEAHFLEQLKHPHILSLLDVGISENKLYLVTPYAAGGSLRDRLKKNSPHLLPIEQSVHILSQIGQALQYAHRQNIIHRDLKPENILFTTKGDVLLADFGIATILSTVSMKYVTVIGGTPPYMAPEQFQGHISKESDQYALGCIAYELFTGRLPFSAPDFVSMGFKHATEPPVALTSLNPSLPSSLEQTVLKTMAKQRSERYPDIMAFITALSLFSLPTRHSTTPQEEDIPTSLSSRLQPRTYNPERAKRNVTPQKQISANVHRSPQIHPIEIANTPSISKKQKLPPSRWKHFLHFGFIWLEILLLLRFFSRLLGANQDNLLVTFLYNLTHLFVALFNGIFNDQAMGRSVFELSTLIAIVSYGLIFWIVLHRLGVDVLGRTL